MYLYFNATEGHVRETIENTDVPASALNNDFHNSIQNSNICILNAFVVTHGI